MFKALLNLSIGPSFSSPSSSLSISAKIDQESGEEAHEHFKSLTEVDYSLGVLLSFRTKQPDVFLKRLNTTQMTENIPKNLSIGFKTEPEGFHVSLNIKAEEEFPGFDKWFNWKGLKPIRLSADVVSSATFTEIGQKLGQMSTGFTTATHQKIILSLLNQAQMKLDLDLPQENLEAWHEKAKEKLPKLLRLQDVSPLARLLQSFELDIHMDSMEIASACLDELPWFKVLMKVFEQLTQIYCQKQEMIPGESGMGSLHELSKAMTSPEISIHIFHKNFGHIVLKMELPGFHELLMGLKSKEK